MKSGDKDIQEANDVGNGTKLVSAVPAIIVFHLEKFDERLIRKNVLFFLLLLDQFQFRL